MAFDLGKINLDTLGTDAEEDPLLVPEDPTRFVVEDSLAKNPEEEARITKLARETNTPTTLVRQSPKQIEISDKLTKMDFARLKADSPATYESLSNPDTSPLISDDWQGTVAIERALKFSKNLGKTIGISFQEGAAGLRLAGTDATPTSIDRLIPASALPMGMEFEAADMSRLMAERFGIKSDEELQAAKGAAIDTIIGELTTLQQQRKDLTPDDLSTVEQGVRAGIESLAQMAPGFGLMLLSGGRAAPMLATAGVQTFAASYGSGRADGLDAEKAGWYATIDAAIEVGTEILPTGALEQILTGKAGGLKKAALGFLVKEMGTEQLATLGQTINSYMFGLDEQLNEATTTAEIIDIQLQRQAVTAIATVVAGGAQAVAVTSIRKAVESLNANAAEVESITAQEQRTIDELNATSQASKLKERDVETFKQFITKADAENNTTVFIDGAQAKLYLNTKTAEEIAADPALTILSAQVAEAAALQGDVQVGVADFAGHFTGTEHFDALREHMTLSGESVSPFRQEQAKQEQETFIQGLMSQAQENESSYVESQEIFATVRAQLVDSGRHTPAEASALADIVPAYMTVYAKDNGISVAEAYQRTGLMIEGPQTGRMAELSAQALEQTTPVEAANFAEAIAAAKGARPVGAAVAQYNPESYEGMDTFLLDDGKAGFAVTPDGTLVSVFKHPDSTLKGAMDTIVPMAIAKGATKLDAFEGFLTEQYSKFGFEEVGRLPWDDAFTPEGWDKATMGTPDVVLMELKDGNRGRETGAAGVQQAQGQARSGREADGSLRGLPRIREASVFDQAVEVAQAYANAAGFEYTPPTNYVKVDKERAARIANAYEEMQHNPSDPEVIAAYDAMIAETEAQYQAMLDAGIEIEFIDFDKTGDPYAESPRLMTEDVRNNNHMWVFSTKDGFGSSDTFDPVDNPLLRDTKFKDKNGVPMLANDVFRAVHDYFGHVKEGVGFRADGEENAWRAHAAMYSPLARRAMTSETRGQNSWVNFGPHGEANQTATADTTVYADQKIGLLPTWVSEEGRVDETFEQAAFHGTPHEFDKFSLDAIGTGEGAQAFGWGLYFAGKRSIAEFYRDQLSQGAHINDISIGLLKIYTGGNPADYGPNGVGGSVGATLVEDILIDEWKMKEAFENDGADGIRAFVDSKIDEAIEQQEDELEAYPEDKARVNKNLTFLKGMKKRVPSMKIDAEIDGGNLFEVDLPEDAELLDWNATMDAQPESLKAKLQELKSELPEDFHDMIEEGLNATFDELTGRELYESLKRWASEGPLPRETGDMGQTGQPDRDVSNMFNQFGIPGLRYLDAISRDGNEVETHNYVIWDDTKVTVQAVNDELLQAEEALEQATGETRGYYDPANSLIRLTEASDLSTFLHEFAHFMYDTELKAGSGRIAKINQWFMRNAQDVTAEANTYVEGQVVTESDVASYIDTGTSGSAITDSAIRRAMHEQFARGFETYLMEGTAPSIELRNVFRTFSRWLVEVYRSIKGDLKVKLDPEMRAVFDRLLATEEQIAAAEARSQFEPMFTDAAMAGMTEEEFTKYNERKVTAKDKSTETLRDKLIKELQRQTKAWWKAEKQDIIDDQVRILSEQQVYRARETLRGDTLKLDHATVKEILGEERTDKRGHKSVVIPESLRGMTAKGGTGVSPDDAAAFFGYGSGAEMLADLSTAAPIKEVAEANAEAEMISRHGDILTDGTIEREADEAVQNESKGKIILAELKALNKGINQPAIDLANIKAIAIQQIGKLAFREIHPAKFRRAELRAAQEAAVAFEKGDKEAAARAKARQAMNFFLGMEATRAKNETTKIVDRMSRYSKKSVREEIAKAENGYLDQLDRILSRFEFRKSASLKQVDEVNESLQVWAAQRITEDGDALVLSAATLNESYVTHWKNVPFSDLVGISDSVKNIEHVARYANKITRLQDEMDFKQLVQQWVSHMDAAQPNRFKSQRTTVAEGRNWGRMAMAQMTKIPYLASWLDGGDRAGMSHDILVQPFTDAYAKELAMWDAVAAKVLTAIQGRSKEDMKRHNRKLFIREIKDENNDGNLFGHQVLAAALNTGNAGNLRKMIMGEGWATKEEGDVTIENPKLQAVLRHMTKSDWELVQLIWDQMDTLYPELAEVHRRTTGLTPPKVEAVAVDTPFGKFKGGYYPVKYDSNRSFRAEQREDKLNAETESMFGSVGIQASVNASATNERTGYFAPIRLSLDVVPTHFQETIHYITHHDAVRETNKLIKNAEVAAAIKAKLGPEEYAQLKPWLNDIAKDGREAPMKTWWGSILQKLRLGTTLGVMGFKASTGIIQISGLSNTVAEVGLAHTLKAAKNVLGSVDNMKDAWGFATANSKVLATRAKTMDREIKNALEQIQGKRGMLAAVQEASMKHIALIQTYMVDLPSWYAAYYKGMDEWGDEARAYKYADWVIENVQGSGNTKDLATVYRNQSQEARMFTMFMTFFSALWNLERDLVKGAKSGAYSTTNVAAKSMFLFTVPVLFDMLMRGDLGEPDDGDDERLQRFLVNSALFPVQSIPFVRDIASGVIGDFGYNISPLAQMIDTGVTAIPKLIENGLTDGEITKSQVKGATRFIGAATGVPGISQMWATGEHMYDVISEGEELTMHQLLFGPKRD